jgi:hemerythrin-like domain-containing protein
VATASQVARILHEEHFWSVVLINGLETRLRDGGSEPPFSPNLAGDRALLEEFVELLDAMLRHHAFEERFLFPVIRKGGSEAVLQLFEDEHAAMEPLAKRLRAIAIEILTRGMTDQRLADLAATVAEFSVYVMLHIQKEEIAIIRRLDTLIDAETDRALAALYGDQKAATARRAAG